MNGEEQPELPDFDTFQANWTRQAQAQALGTIDSNPDEAARAVDLGKSTGWPARTVFTDTERFEKQFQAQLQGAMIDKNPHLQHYINSDPMAAHVSADDWGPLDKLSESLDKFSESSVLGKAVEGFKAGFDAEGLKKEYSDLVNYMDSPWWKSFVQQSGFGGAAVALMGSQKLFSGVLTGGAAGAGEFARQMGMDESSSNRLVRDLIQLAQVSLAGQAGSMIHPEISEAARVAKPYLQAGKEPPVGIHPAIDEIHVEQAKQDAKNLDAVLKDADSTATGQRSPDHLEAFTKLKAKGEIGIPADKIREFYGETEPAPEDGKLGDLPDIAQRLNAAEATGDDIKIPISSWIKIPKEVRDEFKDFVRFREGGMTLDEAKAPAKPMAEEPEEERFQIVKMTDKGQEAFGEPIAGYHEANAQFRTVQQ